jgi:hypothetical protein
MRRLKHGPTRQLRKRKCKLGNHRTSEEGQLMRRKPILKHHMTLEEGTRKRKNHKQLKNKNRWKLFQQ